ncbi:hypothetical protein CHS0354_009979, partial [Potamilus streckersoni]
KALDETARSTLKDLKILMKSPSPALPPVTKTEKGEEESNSTRKCTQVNTTNIHNGWIIKMIATLLKQELITHVQTPIACGTCKAL